MIHRFILLILLLAISSCKNSESSGLNLSNEEVKSIAKETYIALYPLVYNYGTMYNQAINKNAKEYIGGFGVFKHYGLATPANRDIPTPNNNTPYSWAWIDLRTEPFVLTMPPADGNRYYVSQWDDMWGYVIDAPGSIIDGQNGGDYLLTTSDYKGIIPDGIKRVIYSESNFAGTLTRTGVDGEEDLAVMESIQEGYKLQPLSSYLGVQAPKKAKKIDWIDYNPNALRTIEFFKYANFMLSHITSNKADEKMIQNAKKIGVEAGKVWNSDAMDSNLKANLIAGIQEALQEIDRQVVITSDGKKLFGTRDIIGEDYLNRTIGVIVGQFGNYPSQAMYPGFQKDSNGNLLDASKYNYSITFPAGQLPPSKYFWSFTMYDLPDRFLVKNPIQRYSIGSQTKSLKPNPDGSITIYFQTNSPGKENEGNWLPTPNAPFYTVLRMYGPSQDAINGNYRLPEIIAFKKN